MNVPRIQASILVPRALLLLMAIALAASGLHLALSGDSRAGASAGAEFVCPMHPEATASEPGQCPICQMALLPRSSVSHEHKPKGFTLSSEAAYVCPMHARIGSNAPGRCSICNMPLEPAAAKKRALAPDNTATQARFAPGVTWLPETLPPTLLTRTSDPPALGVAARRVLVDSVTAPAWLEAKTRLTAVLYRDELIGLSPGDRGSFQPAAAPRQRVSVTLTGEPPTAWDSSTVLVRFDVDTPRESSRDAAPGSVPLTPGETGWLELGDRPRSLLVVPESALLRSAEGAYVLVPRVSGRGVERRQLAIGRIRKGQVAVLSGLAEGERIVVGSAFFVDVAERVETEPGPLAGREP